MTSITVYGGVGEIGGNKVLVEDGDVGLFLDFGTSFGRSSLFYEEYLKPRPGAGLLDLLALGLLPPLRGLYRRDLDRDLPWERFADSPLYRETEAGAVLVSHAHLDHCGYVSFLREDIPVYTSALTAFILKAMQDSGGSDFEREVCYFTPRRRKDGYLATEGPFRARPFAFADGTTLSPEARDFWERSPAPKKALLPSPPPAPSPLPFRFFPVDHSVFGAGGFAVQTSAGWVAYTGDLRLHGQNRQKTLSFMQELARLQPVLLLCEGTRAEEDRSTTEAEVYERCLEVVRGEPGLVISDFTPRNVERLLTFHSIAQETGRRLVILPRDAYLLEAMALVSPPAGGISDEIPSVGNFLIYRELRGQTRHWQQELETKYQAQRVGPQDIQRQERDFILCFSFWDSHELIDLAPHRGSYIYSSSPLYDEEQRIDFQRLRNWCAHFGLRLRGDPAREPGFHASGHACGTDLLDLARTVRPRILVPVHTEKPEAFAPLSRFSEGIAVRLPEAGKPLAF